MPGGLVLVSKCCSFLVCCQGSYPVRLGVYHLLHCFHTHAQPREGRWREKEGRWRERERRWREREGRW